MMKNFSNYTIYSLVAQTIKLLSIMQETRVQSLGQEDSLEKEMATCSRILDGKPYGQRSLMDFNLCGHEELDTA